MRFVELLVQTIEQKRQGRRDRAELRMADQGDLVAALAKKKGQPLLYQGQAATKNGTHSAA